MRISLFVARNHETPLKSDSVYGGGVKETKLKSANVGKHLHALAGGEIFHKMSKSQKKQQPQGECCSLTFIPSGLVLTRNERFI